MTGNWNFLFNSVTRLGEIKTSKVGIIRRGAYVIAELNLNGKEAFGCHEYSSDVVLASRVTYISIYVNMI